MRTVDRELPLQSEIALGATLGVCGDDWNHQCAGLDLPADGRIPGIAAAQFALIEPNLDSRCAQRIADSGRGFGILLRVAQKHRFVRFDQQKTPGGCLAPDSLSMTLTGWRARGAVKMTGRRGAH